MKKGTNIKVMLLLHVLLMIYSVNGILSKLAGREEFLSIKFCMYYAGVILVLGIYAIGWQQVIKRMDLTVAFANKSVTVAWGMIWGMVAFHEQITLKMIIGAVIVIIGAVMYSLAERMEK